VHPVATIAGVDHRPHVAGVHLDPSPIARDIIWVVIRARGEEICRLAIPVAELLGGTPYVPPPKGSGDGGGHQPPLLP